MKKLQILIIVFFISLVVLAFTSIQVHAEVVSQPIKVAMSDSAPSATVTVTDLTNPGAPLPSTFPSDGSVYYIDGMSSGDSFTLSFSNGAGSVQDGFSVSNVFSSTSITYTATSSELDLSAYEQVQNTFTASGVSSSDSVTLSSTNVGVSTSIVLSSGNDWSATVWTDSGKAVTFPATSYLSGSTEQWSIGSPVPLTLFTGGNTYTQAYVHQYQVSFDASSNVKGDSSATIVTVGGVPESATSLPFSEWVDSGAKVTWAFSSPVVSSASQSFTQYRWASTSGLDPAQSDTLTVTGSGTVTGNYMTQYFLTVQDGGHGTAGGAGWYDANTNAYATMSPLTVAGATGTQYVFAVWSGSASGSGSTSNAILMDQPKTATATWETQYQVTYVASGNANPVTVPSNEWVTSGNTATGSFPAGQTVGGTKDTFLSDNRPATITTPTTITGLYQVSYLVNYITSGNVVTVTAPSNEWVISGDHATGIFPAQVTNGADNTRSNFVSDDRPSTITAPKTVTGTYSNQYYLTVSTAYGTSTGQDWYNSGATAFAGLNSGTVSGGAGTQYVFTSWSGDASGTAFSSSNAITMNGPLTATANWKTQYRVSFAASAGGSTNPTGSNVWENAGSLSITATPSTGNAFSLWSSDTGSITFDNANLASATATINGPGTITAAFAINAYTITVTQNANGVISPGTGPFNYGSTPTFTITPNAGYHIANITANGATVTVTSPSEQSYQFSPIVADGSLTASFAINTYTITVTQNGNGQIAPGTTTINYGGSQSFTITPSSGYCIASITTDSGSVAVTSLTDQTVSFTNVQGAHTLTAAYAPKNYTLTVYTIGQGSVTPGNGTYPYNLIVTLQATATVGWNFAGWSNGITGTAMNVSMSSDQTLTANFTQNPQPTPTPTPAATVTPTSAPTNAPTHVPTATPTSTATQTNTPTPKATSTGATPISAAATMGQYLPVIAAAIILGALIGGFVIHRRRHSNIIILN